MLSPLTVDDAKQAAEDQTQDLPSPTSSDEWPESEASITLPPAPITGVKPVLTYPKAVAKGRKLLGHLLIPSTAMSTFTSPTSLRQWGYITTHKAVLPGHPFHSTFQIIAPGCIITAKEVSSTHATSTTHDDVKVPSTSARFINAFDFEHGILIAGSNFSPKSTTQHTTLQDGKTLPDLQHWSDAVYLQASFLASEECRVPEGVERPAADAIKDLKGVVRRGIENKDTNAIVHRMLQEKMGPCEYDTVHQLVDAGCPDCCAKIVWPGTAFDIGSHEALALLGTPNGSGVAWLLAQHAELVGKTISRVAVWCEIEEKPLRPSLGFWIEDKDSLDT